MSFAARPYVSFVLATFNRGPILLDCLHKTLDAAIPALGSGHFDIRIVDNASSDHTPDLIRALAENERHIKYLRLPKNCGPVAKNAALHQNAADLIVLLDDDAYPLPGSLPQMVRHFQDDPHLGAAVFDVTLPDGRKEASAYPDVCIGAGTALRGSALRSLTPASRPGNGLLPADFFMQAEEYDLSFRLLANNWTVQRFWDMPLIHLKSPGARIGQRTTLLDVRNNLWLLARYLPQPLCEQFAADWLARYWRMAVCRDYETDEDRSLTVAALPANSVAAPSVAAPPTKSHKAAFLRGAAAGFAHFAEQRGTGDLLLAPDILERIFKFDQIHKRLAIAKERFHLRRLAFGDWGKNLLPFWLAARDLDLEVAAIIDGNLAGPGIDYRGIPVLSEGDFRAKMEQNTDAVVITAMSHVHAHRRAGDLTRVLQLPVIDLFDPGKADRPVSDMVWTVGC